MFATISYIVASAYGAQITPYALVGTVIVDFATMHAFSDWMQSRAMAKIDHVPVAIIAQDPAELSEEDVENMALDADQVEERYGE